MDVEQELTPEFNSYNFQEIIHITQDYPTTSSRNIESIEAILTTKSARDLFAIRKSMEFFFKKDSLTQSIFDFVLESKTIQKLANFLPVLEKIALHKQEILEFITKLSEVEYSEKILNRFEQFKADLLMQKNMDYEFFIALITLIEVDLDAPNTINLLKRSENPVELANAYKLLNENAILEAHYVDFVS